MDAQLSFIMANQALIKNGDLIMDPFVGTGSLLVAAACFGAYVIGTDIDYLMLHGKTRPTRIQERVNIKPKARIQTQEFLKLNLVCNICSSQNLEQMMNQCMQI